MDRRYEQAFTDWLACAFAGRDQPAANAARTAGSDLGQRIAAAGTAGHVLDYDDTYPPGLSHLSAPVAPAALILGAELGASVDDVLIAYAEGVEAMAAVARASHPALYDRGWHPTSVCGVVGSAAAAARLLDLPEAVGIIAIRIALLSAGGLRSAFGSDGKSLQVGMAAAAGVAAARLAASGAIVPKSLPTALSGFETAYGGRWAEPDPAHLAITDNWIKAYPCCLQAHSSIEAAAACREEGAPLQDSRVTVHPVSIQAAPYQDVETGLQAKFSIPYLAAFTFLRGPPGVDDFDSVDSHVRALASTIRVATDDALLESEAAIVTETGFTARVQVAMGSPQRPMEDEQLASKVQALAGDRLQRVLDSSKERAKVLRDAIGL